MTVRAFVAIGSNLGDRHAHCADAVAHLSRLPETAVIQVSPLIETAPAEDAAGGPFLNGMAELATALPPADLLRGTQAIERTLGRPCDHASGTARTIDLDIVLYGDRVVREAGLTIPHPRMDQRRFVLQPLAAIAPSVRHPILHLTAADLLQRLEAGEPPHPASVEP